MPIIRVVEFDGTEHRVNLEEGNSLMQGVVDHDIPGIDGDCGGACACGTCHVYVEDKWVSALPTPDALEKGLLSTRPDGQESSRLACQIIVTQDLDGLTVALPEMQM